MVRVLYLSKNVKRNWPTSYQRDILLELERRAEVAVYGPGLEGYSETDRFSDIVAKIGWRPDCVFSGHRWLSDDAGKSINPHPNLNLQKIDIPLFGILNKEHVNLKAKIDFFSSNPFIKVFSHYHDIQRFNTEKDIFQFWPFAYCPRRIESMYESKHIDLFFSGILKNMNKDTGQSDARITLQKGLFFDINEHVIAKRKPFRDRKIVWNAAPISFAKGKTKMVDQLLRTMFPKYAYRMLEENEYSEKLKRAKILFCSSSPMGLISTRYFEAMAAGAMVLTETAPQLESVFPRSTFVEFIPDRDMEDFAEKLFWYLDNDDERVKITGAANAFVVKNHTWESRIKDVLKEINSVL